MKYSKFSHILGIQRYVTPKLTWIIIVTTIVAMIYGSAQINAHFPIYFNGVFLLFMWASLWSAVEEGGDVSAFSVFSGSILFRILVELTYRYII